MLVTEKRPLPEENYITSLTNTTLSKMSYFTLKGNAVVFSKDMYYKRIIVLAFCAYWCKYRSAGETLRTTEI